MARRLQLALEPVALPFGGVALPGVAEPDHEPVLDPPSAGFDDMAAEGREAERELGALGLKPRDGAFERSGALGGEAGEEVLETRVPQRGEKRDPARAEPLLAGPAGAPDRGRQRRQGGLGGGAAALCRDAARALDGGAPIKDEQDRRRRRDEREEAEGDQDGQRLGQ
jgi:hypothetical protein